MSGEDRDRATEYLDRATTMRQLALGTRYPEVRARLLLMAAGFERLAVQVERWKDAGLVAAAAD